MSSTVESEYEGEVHAFVDPSLEMNLGLWFLFSGATIFLALRLYCKINRRNSLWYDDYVLFVSWMVLLANDSLITHEFRTGYVLKDNTRDWSEHMRLLITISSCGTLIGQAWTKTAFGITLLRMSNRWQSWILWFCIVTMNVFMIVKVIIQWGKVCGDSDTQSSWRIDLCLADEPRADLKEGGNVYNIIMDFVFATFPWLIFRSLNINRSEKIGLCATMSLGMIVAIVSAIRVGWKDHGNDRDAYYIYRNGLSQVWYSSEITGTIIVQCIPVLRPIIRQIHQTRTSETLKSNTAGRSQTREREAADANRGPTAMIDWPTSHTTSPKKRDSHYVALREIPEERKGTAS